MTMDNLTHFLICLISGILIGTIILRLKKTQWWKYDIKADVMENDLNRTDSSLVYHLEEECYFAFRIKDEKDVRKAERVLTRRYRGTKVVRIKEYKLNGVAWW